MVDPIIRLSGISKKFKGKYVVESVDLDIAAGEFFGIVGPSGCGKTTILRMIAGLEIPSSGSMWIAGINVELIPANRRPVNMVFQSYAVFPHMTVESNIGYGLRVEGRSPREITEKVAEVLDLVKLSGLERRRPHELSGGQLQRVALARALIKRPKVLLLDEPLAALDAKLRKAMQDELSKLQRDLGITFVIVTHDQEEALSVTDRVAVMRDGCIQQVASPAELYEFPENSFVANFIGSANCFSGVISNVDGDLMHVLLLDLETKIIVNRNSQFAKGDAVKVVIRPEKIQILDIGDSVPKGNREANLLSGVVTDITYRGDVSMYYIRLHEGKPELLKISEPNLLRSTVSKFARGKSILAYFPAESVWIIET